MNCFEEQPPITNNKSAFHHYARTGHRFLYNCFWGLAGKAATTSYSQRAVGVGFIQLLSAAE